MSRHQGATIWQMLEVWDLPRGSKPPRMWALGQLWPAHGKPTPAGTGLPCAHVLALPMTCSHYQPTWFNTCPSGASLWLLKILSKSCEEEEECQEADLGLLMCWCVGGREGMSRRIQVTGAPERTIAMCVHTRVQACRYSMHTSPSPQS